MDTLKCPVFGKCGNCTLLNKEYSQTLKIKKDYVNSCLKKEGLNVTVNSIIGMDDPYAYRNKMIISFAYDKGRIKCGFFEEKSHKIVEIDECLMHSSLQNEIAQFIKELVIKYKVKIYDEDKRTGLLRHVLIREGHHSHEVLITFVTSELMFPSRGIIVKEIVSKFKEVKTIVKNINPRKTSIVLGEKEEVLYGNGMIEDSILGFKFLITSKSFYQINPIQVEKLYSLALEKANFKGNETIIDAYSGIGTIGIIASKMVKKVISVESNRDAFFAAIKNAKINKVDNCIFYNDDATNFIKQIHEKIDAVIMDPPRSGSSYEFLKTLLKIKPRKIIYVSCGPDTLARDLAILTKNYKIESVDCVDMFCFTDHIESIATLSLNK